MSKMNRGDYLRQYLEQTAPAEKTRKTALNTHDQFLAEVQELTNAQGWNTRIGHEVADLSLDLLIIPEHGKMVAIDLIGYPGAYIDALSLSAYKVLHRAGVRTFPLPYTFWKLDREKCEQAVIDFVNQNL